MKRIKPAFALAVLLGLLGAAPLRAAGPPMSNANWDNLKRLTPGDDVRIVLHDKKSYRAKFQSVADDAIVLRLASGDQTFNRRDVLRISTRGPSRRLRHALIGAAVGAGIGVAAAAGTRREDTENPALGYAVLPPLFAGFGAGIGAFVPSGWHDVYRAQ